MSFPVPQHFTSIESAIHTLFSSDTQIVTTSGVSGGDINDSYKLTLSDGRHIFMKSNSKGNASFFTAEAMGLSAIAQTKTIGTPDIICTGTDDGRFDCSFLLMDFIESKGHIPNYWETFAHQLAEMHKAPTGNFVDGGKYGFVCDNYIGARKQINTANESWIAFFRDCRLEPQFKAAAAYFDSADSKKISKLLDHIDNILVDPGQPSLLHGDLWSGNFITGSDGKAWLIDPAVYVGHAEADIAMTELFGGFSQVFYSAYEETGLLQPEYNSRRDIYNLYHLLNHLNMFGRSYLSSVKRIVDKYAK